MYTCRALQTNKKSNCPVGQVDHTFGCPAGRTTCPPFSLIFLILAY